jgi:hypothetical protein
MNRDRKNIYTVVAMVRSAQHHPASLDLLMPETLEDARRMLTAAVWIIATVTDTDRQEQILDSALRAADRLERKPES